MEAKELDDIFFTILNVLFTFILTKEFEQIFNKEKIIIWSLNLKGLVFSLVVPIIIGCIPIPQYIIYIIYLLLILIAEFILYVQRCVDNLSVDFKYVAYFNSSEENKFLKELNIENLEMALRNRPYRLLESEGNYIHSKRFFSNDFDEDFETLAIRNSDKNVSHEAIIPRIFLGIKNALSSKKKTPLPQIKQKLIVQCSFLPIDKNNNTILIKRGKHHSLLRNRIGELSTISFSPIPRKFSSSKFDPLDIYHREVPYSEHEPNIKEIMFILNGKKGLYYLFYIYVAKYERVDFLKNNEVNWDIIKNIFRFEKNGEMVYFKKDNDEIAGVENIRNIDTESLKPIEKSCIEYLQQHINNIMADVLTL